jgi:hypothetical protein
MFIHGARAVLLRVKYDTGTLGQWAQQLELRAARSVVVVAPADKLARIAWAVLSSGEHYRAGSHDTYFPHSRYDCNCVYASETIFTKSK